VDKQAGGGKKEENYLEIRSEVLYFEVNMLLLDCFNGSKFP
jgi:hypothetical protein